MAAISDLHKEILNRMNRSANKVQLGTIIQNISAGVVPAGSISTAELADDAVDADKLAADAVVTASIVDANVVEAKLQSPSDDSLSVKRVARATYDFDVDGGAVSAIGLGVSLPDNAVIINSFYEVITAMASSGNAGTFALSVESANDIVTAVDADTVSGLVAGIPEGTLANAVKLTSEQEITFTIAVEDLTAGKVVFFLEYVVSD